MRYIACQKDEQKGSTTFSAIMEDCADREDKTTLVNNRLFWESGDEVMIYGSSTNGVFTAVPNAHNATQAEFVGSTNLGSSPYYAIYPASIAVSRNSVNLPAVQTSPDGLPKCLPMYEQTNNRNLHFHNLCGLLKLHLTKPGVTISSVTFVAEEGTKVSGGFSVAYNSGNLRLTPTGIGRNWLRLQCTAPQSIATGGDFYLYLPEGNYQNFRIEIRTSDGLICTKTSNAPKNLVIERSYCTTITLGSDHLTFVPDIAAELVDGPTFNAAIPENATAVVFEYNSSVSSGTLLSTANSPVPIYGNLVETIWTVSTSANMINANPNCNHMFGQVYNDDAQDYRPCIETIYFGSGFNTSNVTDMSYMFSQCFSLTSLDVSNFNTSNVTNMAAMFGSCHSLSNLELSNFNTSDVTNMCQMFWGCGGLTRLDVSNFNTSSVTNMYGMFNNCFSLTSLDVSNFNTSNVTQMQFMFTSCSNLTNLNVSNFNTSSVTSMDRMFYECSSLTSLDLSNFNTSSVHNMSLMFCYCSGLNSIDVSNFNTANVTVMAGMFAYCNNLTSINLSNFNTSNVTNLGAMFSNCSSLTSLNLSSFNTYYVENTFNMLENCTKLANLDLSNFNMSNVTDKGRMCYNLSTTSGHCTITCPEAVETAMQSGTGLPTSGVTFTWVRP